MAVLTELPALPLPDSELAQNILARLAATERNREINRHSASGGAS